MRKLSFITLILTISLFACGNEEQNSAPAQEQEVATNNSAPKSQAEIDDELIRAYLDENDIDAESNENGLYYVINEPGEGDHPALSNIVIMHYKGYKLDGTVFESSYDSGQPLRYQLGRLIEGWRQGVPLLGRGGKATLFIPSGMAYGKQNPPGIGANATLIFDVELLDFEN